ncbi:MAG: hypothetical protein NTY19_23740 [Planctomycetota bacterium]|nr:hypothetical protein [Planctomycetota bacterium]
MHAPINPFHENYITETTTPADFVEVFSPLLLSETLDTLAVFQPGNVVVVGIQGTGKSMLLSLLKPETRIAYAQKRATPFPVPEQFSHYIGAGINLTRSGILDFGQRSISPPLSAEEAQLPIYFGDFLNYWIVRDIIRSIKKLLVADAAGVGDSIGLNATAEALDKFAIGLSAKDCWFGYLREVRDLASLEESITQRITAYRGFLNYNSDIPENVASTKTSIGEPISAAVDSLRDACVVPDRVQFFIRIDQYEELMHLEDWSSEKGMYRNYRDVIHKLLGLRDPRVSYRIGTRRYAWTSAPQMFGTKATIEEMRNLKTVDLDQILCRLENRPWLFPAFAEDVFGRRLRHAGYDVESLKDIFGPRLSNEERAKLLAGRKPSGAIDVEDAWPTEVRESLLRIAEDNPLSAKLGEAWVRQNLGRKGATMPQGNLLPWEVSEKKYWKKERLDQALLQIAARRKQRMIWSDPDQILELSAGNILAFVDLCQYIWAAWLRSFPEKDLRRPAEGEPPRIHDHYLQNEGIQQASRQWYAKIRSETSGDSRRRFITHLGSQFRNWLRDDKKMSSPGFNGFSLPVRELEDDPEIAQYLAEATAFGVLIERHHTSRTKGRGECRKWQLHPILCPYFDIPSVQTKEPKEVHVRHVREWLVRADVFRPEVDDRQPTLFDMDEE